MIALDLCTSCDSADGHVQVIVTDTGLGIPADRLSSVFEPLTLPAGMGGELSARRTVGEGSSFELKLRKVDA